MTSEVILCLVLVTCVQHPHLGYPYDSGWYFYKDQVETVLDTDAISEIANNTVVKNKDEASSSSSSEEEEEDKNHDPEDEDHQEKPAIQVVFVSLWYWWKEVTFISFFTAIMMNIFITRPMVENIRENFRRKLNLQARKQAVRKNTKFCN